MRAHADSRDAFVGVNQHQPYLDNTVLDDTIGVTHRTPPVLAGGQGPVTRDPHVNPSSRRWHAVGRGTLNYGPESPGAGTVRSGRVSLLDPSADDSPHQGTLREHEDDRHRDDRDQS